METAVVCVDDQCRSFQHSNCEAREWLSSQGCCWMPTGVSGHSRMPFKVTLHPSRQDLDLDLVVWMEAALQQKSLQSVVELLDSMRFQHPSSLTPSLPADWV